MLELWGILFLFLSYFVVFRHFCSVFPSKTETILMKCTALKILCNAYAIVVTNYNFRDPGGHVQLRTLALVISNSYLLPVIGSEELPLKYCMYGRWISVTLIFISCLRSIDCSPSFSARLSQLHAVYFRERPSWRAQLYLGHSPRGTRFRAGVYTLTPLS